MAKQVLEVSLDSLSLPYSLFLAALAAAIAWIVTVAKGTSEDKSIERTDSAAGSAKTFGFDSVQSTERTATACYQATVVAILLYVIFKHY